MSNVAPIPEGYHTVTPHLICQNAEAAIEFYKKAFGAEEICRMPGPGGQGVMHGELRIGNSNVFLCDEFPDMGAQSPKTLGGSPVTLHVYVDDCDKLFQQALDAGATATMPPQDQFWGDRYAKLTDPFGHSWSIATHVEDVAPEEMEKRMMQAFGGGGCGDGACGCG
jgi:PhnB protein